MSAPTAVSHAMVLAAGLGTRMRPITDKVPKPLVEVAGKTLLDHALDRVAEAGIGSAIVNVHHLADQIEAHLANRQALHVTLSDERDLLLETGGGIRKALSLLGDKPFLVLNSDSFWVEGKPAALPRLIEAFDPARMDMLLLMAASVTSTGYHGRGDFDMAPDGLLARRDETMVAPFIYTGIAIIKPALFDACPDGPFSLNLLFDRAIEAGRLYGQRLDGLWMHVGTPDAIEEAERAIGASIL